MRNRRLQNGLGKLVPAAPDTAFRPQGHLAEALELDEGVNRMAEAREIAWEQIHPDPDQPRQSFDEAALEELAASIREQGVLQPITVIPDESGFQIVAGERRWRAARIAGLSRVPALVRNLSTDDRRIVALMENLQREDLNDIDRARGLENLRGIMSQRLPESRSHDLDNEVGRRLGISGRAVRNFTALLSLPDAIQHSIASGKLTEKHGRALRRLPEIQQEAVAEIAGRLKLTGDETLQYVKTIQTHPEADVDALAWQAKAGNLPVNKALPVAEEPQADSSEEASRAWDRSLGRIEFEIERMENRIRQSILPTLEAQKRLENLGGRLLHLARETKGDAEQE